MKLSEALAQIRHRDPDLLILRGPPGSGKSTLAAKYFPERVHAEADHYMLNEAGVYEFDPRRLGYCHRTCREKIRAALVAGQKAVVCNTLIKRRDLREYTEMADELGKTYIVVTVEGYFDNKHGVSPEQVAKLRQKISPWEGEIHLKL